jgi:hypothetical protein
MNVHDPQIADALLNEPQYVAQLMEMPDSALSRKLGIVRRQMTMAYQQQLTTSLELLAIWERQIIEARSLKGDFSDAPARKKASTSKRHTPGNSPVQEYESNDTTYPGGQIFEHEPASAASTKPAQLELFG